MIRISNFFEALGKQAMAEREGRECLYRAVGASVGPRVERAGRFLKKLRRLRHPFTSQRAAAR